MIRSSGPPDKTTPGNVGDIYQNTDNGEIFVCKDVKHRPIRQQFIEVSAKDVNTEYVWETTKVEPYPEPIKFDDCTEIFKENRRLGYIDKFDFSETTNMNNMFYSCTSLTTIPQMDTSNVTDMNSMFYGCTKLTTIPQMDTSNTTNMGNMFSGCRTLKTIPQMNTSNVTSMSYMFSSCPSLTTIPQMDISKVTNMSSMFNGCTSLTNLDLRNIKVNLQIGSGTSWGHLLTVDSLVNTIKELVTQTSYKTLTMGTANLEKIANLYCKIIDDTDPKKTMELCESTEEGAITLRQYAQLKKWNIN